METLVYQKKKNIKKKFLYSLVFSVHTTVRNKEKSMETFKSLGSLDNLKIFEADLLKENSFDDGKKKKFFFFYH